MVVLLLVAAPTYFVLGETTDGVATLAALVPIAGVGAVLERRAERTLEQLRALTSPTASVERDGTTTDVPVESLVVGDVVHLHEGDVVPADCEVLEVTQLQVDEAALTGESLPVAKALRASAESVDDGASSVWAGTTVMSGQAIVEVRSTGAATRYGQIGTLLAAVRPPATPLQRSLARLVRSLAIVAAVFCSAAFVAELAHGKGWGSAVIAGVSLAIAAIPEEFTMVYTLYLALGAWRLAQHHSLVRRLPSVETLGSTTVICVDKTGTLTHGTLTVAGVWLPTITDENPSDIDARRRALLEHAVLACEPTPFDPLDRAIVRYAEAAGVDVQSMHAQALVADWPFDPIDRYLIHVWRTASGAHQVAAKGSLEGILDHTDQDLAERLSAVAANQVFAADGMRVIAVAGGSIDVPTGDRSRDEQALQFLGLVAFSDPVRDGVAEALEECRAAGVRVMMLTGDHPATAHAVAEGLRLPHNGPGGGDLICTGDDLDRATPAERMQMVADANVFARIRPEQKHLLVSDLRAQGEVVAMTGDGINDAAALREADIGVAMGVRGTDVAREAASLVLVDDNFATIVRAVRDGRRIFDNLTRAFAYVIAFHAPLLVGALVMPLLGEPLLLLPIHLVVLELVLHPVISLVFQADPADDDVMHRPPRPVGDALRLRRMWRSYVVGGVFSAAIIGAYLIAIDIGWSVEQARGLAFVTLLAGQPLLLLGARSPDLPLWSSGHPSTRTLRWVLTFMAALPFAVVFVGPVADLLRVASFPARGWLAVLAISIVAPLSLESSKHGRRNIRP